MSAYFFTCPSWLVLVLAAAAAASVFCIVLWILLRTGVAWRLATDIPNDRSLHVMPTPRVGGWGVVPPIVAAVLLLAPSLWLPARGTRFLGAVFPTGHRR